MLSYLAVVFWWIFFSYVLYTIIRKYPVSLTLREVLLAYESKVVMGCLYGYIFLHYFRGDDTWLLHANSIKEKQMLLHHPWQFFSEFTPGTAIANGNGIINVLSLYFVDLEYCLQAKTLGIINLITNDNYYINVVFWNFILFWGHYWFFTLLVKAIPGKRKLYFILVFLFPPVIFWLSGIRPDGMLFTFFALVLLYFHKWITTYRLYSMLVWFIGFIGVLIFRPQVAALLIPAMISWWLAARFTKRPLLQFICVYSVAVFLFFISTFSSSTNLPSTVVQKQEQFMRLRGTSFQLDTLQPTIKSFVMVLPQAISNTFIRPFLWEIKGTLQGMAALDIILFWGFIILIFFHHVPSARTLWFHPLVLVMIFFGVSMYLFIGYIVPFPGAIIRYKVLAELCFYSVFMAFLKTNQPKMKINSNI